MYDERRREPRYVVDGLRAELDGQPSEILDISASALRLLRSPAGGQCAAEVRLRLSAEAGFPAVDLRSHATLIRFTPDAMVYAYRAEIAEWPFLLKAFDTFQDLSLPALEA